MIQVTAGSRFSVSANTGEPGLLGQITLRIVNVETGKVFYGPTVAGISEPNSGLYVAVLTAPPIEGEWLIVFSTEGAKPRSYSEQLLVAAAVTPTPGLPLTWLRRLLDDVGAPELQQFSALTGQTEFFIAAPPMLGPPTVFLQGKELSSGWMVPETVDRIVFSTPLKLGEQVVVRYTRQTFSTAELEEYLNEAKTEYIAPKHLVYRAAIFALDTLRTGVALAFDFGAGDENFRFSDVDARLTKLRDGLEKWLQENAEEGHLEVVAMTFDELEPGDIEWDIGGTEFGVGGYFPDQPSSRGGLQ